MSQLDLAKVTEAFGHAAPWSGPWTDKPKVLWVHGAECTGCSTSLLSLFENAAGVAVPGATSATDISTASALAVIAGDAGANLHNVVGAKTYLESGTLLGTGTSHVHRSLAGAGLNVDHAQTGPNAATYPDLAVNIADVLIDFIDLQYHETVMAQGGDAAYNKLATEMAGAGVPFMLVVEGAVQNKDNVGYWNKPGGAGTAPWCSIAADGTADTAHELAFDDVVEQLAIQANCLGIVAIGQCACYGGYPACQGPDLLPNSFGKNMTGAQGVYDFLCSKGYTLTHAKKVVNVPGCPTNPWWFVLTVVAWLVDAVTATATTPGALGILKGTPGTGYAVQSAAVDTGRRLVAVYGNLLHGKYCPRYGDYAAGNFASKPGDPGCLRNIGCKGIRTYSLCGRHGWNAAAPQNNAAGVQLNAAVENLAYSSAAGSSIKLGGCCLTVGAPCMGCTQKGYPDGMTPFVAR